MPEIIKLGLQKAKQTCSDCVYFEHCPDPDDGPDEVDGYCTHPNHFDPKKSPHHEYGGHWTHSDSRCDWWQTTPLKD